MWYSYLVVGLLVLIFGVVLVRSIRIVPQARAGIIERLGRFNRVLGPGLESSCHLLID